MKVVIPGGAGQVGTLLARAFHRDGHDVVVLSRQSIRRPWRVVSWNGLTLDDGWVSEIDGSDVVVNLAGRSVNCRYTPAFMRVLRDAGRIPFGLPAARWMLEVGAVIMQTETELVLKSRRVVPARLLEHGFVFTYPRWAEAARDLCDRWRQLAAARRAS